MRRLRDQIQTSAPLQSSAARLLRSASRDPSPRKKRLLAELAQSAAPSVYAKPFARPAFAALAFFGSLALAWATLGNSWWRSPVTTPVAPAEVAPAMALPTASVPTVVAPTVVAPTVVAPTVVAPTAPAVVAHPAVTPPTDRALKATAPKATAPKAVAPVASASRRVAAPSTDVAPAAPDTMEMAGVLSAVKALRRDHDPDRATALLEEYFQRYPKGALLEEALALAIEAAAEPDPARAASLATRYLAHYPNGRFAETARHAKNFLAE